jgi:hypothetical protein
VGLVKMRRRRDGVNRQKCGGKYDACGIRGDIDMAKKVPPH